MVGGLERVWLRTIFSMKKNTKHSINPAARQQFHRRKTLTVEEYVEGIRTGNRVVLSRAITLIESTRSDHHEQAQAIIAACLPHAGTSVRVGVTGTPGVGKSTFIEALGKHVTDAGHRIAVLTIDPTSQVTQGSILGDKTRMPNLATNENAFIRPSPAGDSLGGVARKTREAIVLCEAAGYDMLLVETVGVGQSETAVHSMVDFFLLLLLPGAGDELQGIKRGIVEMADLIAVNKADKDKLKPAQQARRAYKNAIHFYPPKSSGWTPEVMTCSALEGTGIAEIWETIQRYKTTTQQNNFWTTNRQQQATFWLYESIKNDLHNSFFNHQKIKEKLSEIEAEVAKGKLSPFKGAEELVRLFFNG